MTRDDILRLLRTHRPALERLGVTSIAIFGSTARDEARPKSDVDILVEIRRPMGLFEFIGIKEDLEQLLGRPVDLTTPDGLHPALRDQILEEAVYA